MTMARGLISLTAVCALAAWGSSAAASPLPSRAAECGPAAAKTLAASSRARVYSQGGSVYGCIAGARRSRRLGSAGLCIGTTRISPVAVVGELAAYGAESCGVDTGSTLVQLRRLSDGRTLFSTSATTASPGAESYQQVGSIVVRRSRALAWIVGTSSLATHRQVKQVLEREGSGSRVLATGAGIELGSLRLRGSQLSWRDNGAEHTARLS